MIQYLIANRQYKKASQQLATLYKNECAAIAALPQIGAHRLSDKMPMSLRHLEYQLYDHYLSLLLEPNSFQLSRSAGLQVAENADVRQRFKKELLEADLPFKWQMNFSWVDENENEIVSSYQNIITHLRSDFTHEVPLTAESAALLSSGLCRTAKEQLCAELQKVVQKLDDGDVLIYAADAFIQLLYQDKESSLNIEKNERVLKAFSDIKNVYPQMSRNLFDSLIKYLNKDGSISDLSLFGPYAGSHQKALISYLSEGRLQRLRTAFLARINRLSQSKKPMDAALVNEWIAHGRMFILLSLQKGPSQHQLEKGMQKLKKEASRIVERLLLPITLSTTVEKMPLNKVILSKNKLLKAMLLMKSLGSEDEKEQIAHYVTKLLARQRKLIMLLKTTPEIEQFITISADFVQCCGTITQAQHSETLVNAWHLYCRDLALWLSKGVTQKPQSYEYGEDIRRQAVIEALDDYLDDLDARIFGYFSKQFSLKGRFREKAEHFREILTKDPKAQYTKLSEGMLWELLKNTQSSEAWHWHSPQLKDAEQLFVGLCISAKAHQWATHFKDAETEAPGSPIKLCETLKSLAIDLIERFHLGQGQFTSQLSAAIGAANDYFITVEHSKKTTEIPQTKKLA